MPRLLAIALMPVICLGLSSDITKAQEDIAALVEQAREEFQPVSNDQLAAARAEVLHRIEEVERFVGPRTSNGQRWLRYLRSDELREALSQDGLPDLQALDNTLERLRRDENGLELRQFRRLADALKRYRDLVAVAQWENPNQLYDEQLEALESDVSAYREDPSPANEARLGERLRVISDLGQAPELVQAVRREFARPNVYLDVSTRLIAAGTEPIRRTEPITDNILGTRIHGDAHTNGVVEVATIPSRDRAVIEFGSRGNVVSHNTGYNGPAVIRSTGHTNYTANKRVELSDRAFISYPASAAATTDTDIHSIAKRGGGLGSRLVSSRGWQQARQQKGQAEAIAADHAEDRIERRFDDEVNDEVREAREQYESEYRDPLVRRGQLPPYIRFSSGRNSISVEVAQVGGGQLGASDEPPPAPEGHDMTMRVHQSAANNYTEILLGGATASETRPGEDAKFNVNLPDWIKKAWERRETDSSGNDSNGEEFTPWSMTFADRPVSIAFDDGKVKITTRVTRLQSGDQTFENWDITGIYVPELAGGGVVLHRDGDLEMLPADFDGSLSSRQTAERRNLEEELNKRSAEGRGFPSRIELGPIEPEGALADAGPLELNEFASDDGWLTLAWDRRRR